MPLPIIAAQCTSAILTGRIAILSQNQIPLPLAHGRTGECGHLTEILLMQAAAAAKSLQSCLTLCDPIDGCPPSSSVPGILQARTLEWVAISCNFVLLVNQRLILLIKEKHVLPSQVPENLPRHDLHGLLPF